MNKPLLLCGLMLAPAVQAWDCEYEKQIDQTLDLSDAQTLTILARAGDLEVHGKPGTDSATIRGTLCVSEEEWLEQSGVEARSGADAEIEVYLPKTSGWSWSGNRYAYLDLNVQVPDGIEVKVKDSSGDIEIEGLADVSVKDSSGDIELEDISGTVTLEDSSGDIELGDISGDVIVESDSSGDIDGDGIEGNVLVIKDSSGDIRFRNVGKNFTVERDSSGDIVADTIGGDFEVQRDGSGEIRSSNVSGTVKIPKES
jgi:hypothetical protein